MLGGGLFTPLTGRIVRLGLRIGMRLAVLPLLKQEMAELVETIDDEDGKGKGRARSKREREQGEMSHEPEGTAQSRQGRHSGNDGAADEDLDGRLAGGTLGTFGVGLLVGAGLGLLLAPKAGRELRDDLRDASAAFRRTRTTRSRR